MASQSRDFQLICDGHKCEHCQHCAVVIDNLKKGAESQCPLSRVRLASLEWNFRRFALDSDGWYINYHGRFRLQASALQASNAFIVELFDLSGK
jgi:hypothetical protein